MKKGLKTSTAPNPFNKGNRKYDIINVLPTVQGLLKYKNSVFQWINKNNDRIFDTLFFTLLMASVFNLVLDLIIIAL